ncbi:MAG: fructose-6-phosphate aldolase [Candidatus Undinarchaeales archaeon]
MEFFIDTANIDEIKWTKELGMLDGVTTNPTLLSREGNDPEEQCKKIIKLCDGPVSVEVIATDKEGMVEEAEKFSKWGNNVVVKIPMTEEGLKAVKVLSKKGIKTNVTLVFSANQALLAAKAGATYVSPFIGRLDDRGERGMEVVEDIVEIFDNYGFETKVLAASIRNLDHVKNSALTGSDVATIPPKVIKELAKHELTDAGLKRFLEDWKKLEK